MMTQTLNLVMTKDGEQIAVWKIENSVKNGAKKTTKTDTFNAKHAVVKAQNIFLTHGTFSDKQTCLKIAEYLASIGHRCYIMEWRGHGDSSIPKEKFNFETVATYDYEATFRYFFEELKLNNLHCVTHSGGGVGLAMFLIQNPRYIDKINSASMFACQSFGAVSNPVSYAKILTAKLLTRLFGYIPAKRLKLGPFNESYYTMNQWFDWNLQKNFESSFIKQSDVDNNELDKNAINRGITRQNTTQKHTADDNYFDYRQHMPMITIPIYAISAKGDNFISPTSGCQLFFDAFGNSANVFREYSLSRGDLDDYTHSRIMISRNAATEVWPTVVAWIEQHAS